MRGETGQLAKREKGLRSARSPKKEKRTPEKEIQKKKSRQRKAPLGK
jgi:hypothetical protein